MTITPPVVGPIDVSAIPTAFRAHTDIQPFTYRSAMTYTQLLESMRSWTLTKLIPYLNANFEDLQGSWVENVTNFVQLINEGLAEQSADNAAAIQAALNEIAESSVTITDPAMLAALESASSQTLEWLDTRYGAGAVSDQHVKDVISGGTTITTDYLATLFGAKATQDLIKVFYAPAPRGLDGNGNPQDDTAILQALVNSAQSTNGTLILQPGTYYANLATSQSFSQPVIIGAGRDYTRIKAWSNASPVFRAKGGAGQISGGMLRDIELQAATVGGGIGLELADTTGFHFTQLRFKGNFDTQLNFKSESTNAFCEYNTGDADFRAGATTTVAVRYTRTSGNESFHGSGITKGSTLNQPAGATVPFIIIGSGSFPYGSPLDAAIFPRNSAVPIIQNLNTGRQASFQGNLDIEVQQSAANVYIADPGTSITAAGATSNATGNVAFEGGIVALISGTNLRYGKLIHVDSIYYQGGTTFLKRRPFTEVKTMTTGANDLTVSGSLSACIMHVEFNATNYNYVYTLLVSRDSFNGNAGNVVVLGTHKSLNTAGYGAPTFTYGTNGKVIATNASFPSSGVTAYVSIVPFNHERADDRFAQY